MKRQRYSSRSRTELMTYPFSTTEEAWFWFMDAYSGMQEGLKPVNALNKTPRPCEPLDIIRWLERLIARRVLRRGHLSVLTYFGRLGSPPNPSHPNDQTSLEPWREGIKRLGEVLVNKGVVKNL